MSYECNIDLTTALDWQRSKADIVQKLIKNQQEWLNKNHCEFWDNWIKDVFTLKTANEFGLSVWSIILDEPIYGYSGASPGDYPDWGFSDDSENFFNGSFAVDDGYTYEFTLEQKRIILQLKAYQVLSMSGPIGKINESMNNIFGNDVILCFDKLDMSFVYQLNDNNIASFITEIRSRDLLPRPIGIDASEVRIMEPDTFGFASDDENFYDGNFYNGTI